MENFTNSILNINELPKLESLDYNKLDKNYLTETLIIRLVFILPLAALVFVVYFKQPDYLLEAVLAAIALFIVFMFFGYLSFFKKAYALRQKDVSYRRGIVFHSITTIPLSRIQHSELLRGPLDRMLGLSSVKIYTAGGSSSDITLPGLPLKTAEKVREFINNKGEENVGE